MEKKKASIWCIFYSILDVFLSLKLIWIKGICTFLLGSCNKHSFKRGFLFAGMYAEWKFHINIGLQWQESIPKVYNQSCRNFIFPSAVYGTPKQDNRQHSTFQVSIHFIIIKSFKSAEMTCSHREKRLKYSHGLQQLQIIEQNLRTHNL